MMAISKPNPRKSSSSSSPARVCPSGGGGGNAGRAACMRPRQAGTSVPSRGRPHCCHSGRTRSGSLAGPAHRQSRATSTPSWTLTATDFANASQLAEEHQARAILILGPGASSLKASALGDLAGAVMSASTDLAVPRYDLPPRAGLINSAILYPLTRSLFVSRARFPLAVDLGLSLRMAQRLAAAAQRFPSLDQKTTCFGPSTEAAVAGFNVSEIDAGPRATPQPADSDISSILASVTGSLFADIDSKAAFWQRARRLPPARQSVSPAASARRGPTSRPCWTLPAGLYQPAGDLVAGAAAQHAARPEAPLPHGSRVFPHAGELVGAHRLRLSPRLPAAHHQPRASAGGPDSALSGVGGRPHQHHCLRQRTPSATSRRWRQLSMPTSPTWFRAGAGRTGSIHEPPGLAASSISRLAGPNDSGRTIYHEGAVSKPA